MASSDPRTEPRVHLGKTQRTRLGLVAAIRAELGMGGDFTAEGVSRRVACSQATFYNHFADKDDALAAAFSEVLEDLVAFLGIELRIERVLEQGLSAFARDWTLASTTFFRRHTAVFRAAQMRIPVSRRLRDVFRIQEAAAFECYVRFVALGQAARVMRSGDPEPIARILMVTSEGWNHPAVLKISNGDPLHMELARSVVRLLEPNPTTGADPS